MKLLTIFIGCLITVSLHAQAGSPESVEQVAKDLNDPRLNSEARTRATYSVLSKTNEYFKKAVEKSQKSWKEASKEAIKSKETALIAYKYGAEQDGSKISFDKQDIDLIIEGLLDKAGVELVAMAYATIEKTKCTPEKRSHEPPLSYHLIEASSAIFLTGAYRFKKEHQKTLDEIIAEYEKVKVENAQEAQIRNLEFSIKLKAVQVAYTHEVMELRKVTLEQFNWIEQISRKEKNVKAQKVAHHNKKKNDYKKKYDREKKLAAGTGGAHHAHLAKRYYDEYKKHKEEESRYRVYTHTVCKVETAANFSIHDLFELIIPSAHAEEAEKIPLKPIVAFKEYFQSALEEMKKQTKNRYPTPEGRHSFIKDLLPAVKDGNNSIADTQRQLIEQLNQYHQLRDDFENYKKEKQKEEAIENGFIPGQYAYSDLNVGTGVACPECLLRGELFKGLSNFDSGIINSTSGDGKNALGKIFDKTKGDEDKREKLYFTKKSDSKGKDASSSADKTFVDELRGEFSKTSPDAWSVLNDPSLGKLAAGGANEDGKDGVSEKGVKKSSAQVGKVNIAASGKGSLEEEEGDDKIEMLEFKESDDIALEEVKELTEEELELMQQQPQIDKNREKSLFVIISERYHVSGIPRLLRRKELTP